MAARIHGKIHNVNQTKKMTPLTTRETAFSRDSVGSRHVPHHRTSSFDDHHDHSVVVFKNVQLGFARGIMCVCGDII